VAVADRTIYWPDGHGSVVPIRAVDNGDGSYSLDTDAIGAAVATTPAQFIKTVAATGTPEAIAPDGTYFQSATLIGLKAARTNNVGNVFIGIGAPNDTQIITLTPGEIKGIKAPPGQKFDFNDFYVDVLNAGDGVAVVYS
jgi:hypothetical protein